MSAVSIRNPVPANHVKFTQLKFPGTYATPSAFAAFTRAAVLAGPWDQSILAVAVDAPDQPCDVGTKLAAAFGLVSTYEFADDTAPRQLYRSEEGIDAACTSLNLNRAGLQHLFGLCGVPRPYLTPAAPPPAAPTWAVGREVVWNRLAMIGKLPPPEMSVRIAGRIEQLIEANLAFWRVQFGIDVGEQLARGHLTGTYHFVHRFWDDLAARNPGLPNVATGSEDP